MARYGRHEDLLRLALLMQGSAEGIALADIAEEFGWRGARQSGCVMLSRMSIRSLRKSPGRTRLETLAISTGIAGAHGGR